MVIDPGQSQYLLSRAWDQPIGEDLNEGKLLEGLRENQVCDVSMDLATIAEGDVLGSAMISNSGLGS